MFYYKVIIIFIYIMNPFENIQLTNMIKFDNIESDYKKSTVNLPIESIQNQILKDNQSSILSGSLMSYLTC